MKKLIILGTIILVIAGGLLFLRSSRNQTGSSPVTSPQSQVTVSPQTPKKTFTVEGKPFSFSVQEIKVKKGDNVQIEFSSTAGMHDWVIDEFNARTQQVSAGQSDTVEFIADKVGTFEYYCSVANHRAMGMVGKLIVEE